MFPAASRDWLLATLFANSYTLAFCPSEHILLQTRVPSSKWWSQRYLTHGLPTMSHVHGAHMDFSNHNILTQLLLHYNSWNKTPTAVFIPVHSNRLYRNSAGISTVPASRQTGLPSKLPFIKVCVIKLGSSLGILPYYLLLPGRMQGQEEMLSQQA